MKQWKLWVGILISAIFIFWFIQGLDFAEVWNALKKANYIYIIPVLISLYVQFALRTERWRFLLMPIKKIGHYSCFVAVIIAFMATNILPMRAGEFVRAFVIGRREDISITSSFATIVVERILDMFTIILMLGLLLVFFPFNKYPPIPMDQLSKPMQEVVQLCSPDRLRAFGFLPLLAAIISIGILFLMMLYKEKALYIMSKILKPLPSRLSEKMLSLLDSFSKGLESLKNGKHLLIIAFYSCLMWFVIGIGPWLLYYSFDINLPWYSGFLIIVIVAFGVTLPQAPGFIGVFQFTCAAAMILVGVPENDAKTFAIVHWFLGVAPITILGFIYLFVGRMSLSQLMKK
ncbi:flippase-like domain-containing protein [bacterium]|nr:flippase-like domain-containing protein [bacterium]